MSGSAPDIAGGVGESRVKQAVASACLALLCVVWFTPVLALLVTSFRTEADASTSGWWSVLFAPRFVIENYVDAIRITGVGRSLVNSIAVAVPTTIGTVLISAIAAYSLAKMSFRGGVAVFLALVGLQVLPPQVVLVPMLKLANAVGINGTFVPVWIFEMGLTIPFGVFLLRGFFAGVPSELIESARIDGASELRIFLQIVLPLSGAVLASLAILQFLIAWNHLLTPLIFLGGTSGLAPLTVQVAGLVQTEGGGMSLLTAATFISIAVPLLIVIALQRYFVRGVLGGAVKG
ncbi:carbohydrate ABC transporter permease [uncultured Alsobacter sp.]|uniref:carbohydrate ABC transporter permease n=1 Tax=uncultured Alsobacter sp. TaxID=1748258 RepID=UPI0025E37013|nr:carbohydrate ABC transporter permease [uncultured Alsobacter sp.]